MMAQPTTGLNSHKKGFTLVELMIAMVLGLILVAGVIQIFISNKQAYRVTDAHSKLQDNARFALDVLSRDVRSAGFNGCRAIENKNVLIIADAPAPTNINPSSIITGSNATATSWTPNISGSLGTVVVGTDVITVQHGESCGGNLTNSANVTGNIRIRYPNSCSVDAGDTFMISDCTDAHVFRVTSVSPNGAGTKQKLAHGDGSGLSNQSNKFCKLYQPSDPTECESGEEKIYDFDSELLIFNSVTYFIRLGVNGERALWAFDNNSPAANGSNPIELIEGIEDMQIVYGSDTDDDDIVDVYSDAEAIQTNGQWDKVIGARISLLAQTQEKNLTTTNQSVTFNGGNVTATEGRLRRVFTTTIGVRNRMQ
jgi:type IV pilus assembly protein PilW